MNSQPVRKKNTHIFLKLLVSMDFFHFLFTQIALGFFVIQFDDPSRKVVNLNCRYRWNWPRFMVKGLGGCSFHETVCNETLMIFWVLKWQD